MVEGLSPRKIAAVDLDGTLICANSLHLYIRAGLRHASLWGKVRILALLALRRMRIISHRRMKFGVLGIINPCDELKADFVASVKAFERPAVKELLEKLRGQGITILLATAASDIYIPWIWDGDFVATRTRDNNERRECRGELKAEAVRNYMHHGDILEVVITDHTDDIPLLMAGARSNLLVEPSQSTLKKLNSSNISFEILS